MKKLILSLFIFCSVFAFSQGTIPIPQIIGLPAALASKVDKVMGKSLVADTSIVKLTGVQASAQVNKLEGIQKNGVDLAITGKKVNITVPTTAAEIGAQPAGTYATGTGTAYNSNTGDETLTSIKTKLGAATSVSDGYLKYQDYVKFDGKLSSEVDGSTTNELQTISTTGAAGNITLSNSGGTLNLNVNDADASPTNEIQDLSLSGNILTLSSDAPVDISQATAVQANTAKVSNATHTGDVTGSAALTLVTVNSNIGTFNNVTINAKGLATAGSNVSYEPAFSKNTGFNKNFGTTTGTVLEGRTFGTAANSAVGDFLHNLSVNTNTFSENGISQFNAALPDGIGGYNYGLSMTLKPNDAYAGLQMWAPETDGNGNSGEIYYRTGFNGTKRNWRKIYDDRNLTSSLTTNYIPKWNGSSFVNATAGTDYQLPITLTTNGTSGAATFSGNVLNVPNYDVSGGVNQTQTTVNGSTSGYIVASMPFQTASYKKVVVYLNALTGNVTYTFPVQFLRAPQINTGNAGIAPVTYTATATSLTLVGGTNTIGWITLEGY